MYVYLVFGSKHSIGTVNPVIYLLWIAGENLAVV